MKKYTITTIIACAFLCFGTLSFLRGAYINLKNEYSGQDISFSTAYNIYESIKQKDGEYLSGRAQVAYFNGACQRLLDKKCVMDPGYTVTRMNNGYLTFSLFPENTYGWEHPYFVDKLKKLEGQLGENGIRLTFSNVLERNPLYDTQLPYEYLKVNQNFDELIYKVNEASINTVDMMSIIRSTDIDHYSLFYRTDHHWNAYGGFFGASCIIDALGYDIDERITDISQYTEETVEDCFLGSYGRRVGPLYAGLDDFTVLYPKFDTDFEVITADNVRNGDFRNSVIFKEFLPSKGNMSSVSYDAFLGGDKGLQVVKNNVCENGKKVLLIRNSYGGAMAPYFSLACEELHIIDMRYYDGVAIAQYAVQEDIDDVVIMYSSGSLNKTCFNFDMEQ